MGLYRTFGDLGFVAGPVFLGWLADITTYGWALGCAGPLLATCGLAFGGLARETVRREASLARPQDV